MRHGIIGAGLVVAALLLVRAAAWAGYQGGMNLYEFEGSNPPANLDPSGLLQRRQVEWLVHNYLGQKDWNIDVAPRLDVKAKVLALKQLFLQDYPEARFSKTPLWSQADDQVLQGLVNEQRQKKQGPLAGIPGEIFTPLTLHDVYSLSKDAIKLFKEDGGTMAVDESLLLAWTLMESTWNPNASAYGRLASTATREKEISTAVGMLQLTRETYERYGTRQLLGRGLNSMPQWKEEVLSNPVASMVAGLFILQNGPGGTLAEKLSGFYDPGDAEGGNVYADKVLKGRAFVDQFLKSAGKSIPELSPKEYADLSNGLHELMGRW